MGFFSDLKEDLNQAVGELLPGEREEQAAENPQETAAEEVLPMGDGQDDEETLKQLAELEEILQGLDLPGQMPGEGGESGDTAEATDGESADVMEYEPLDAEEDDLEPEPVIESASGESPEASAEPKEEEPASDRTGAQAQADAPLEETDGMAITLSEEAGRDDDTEDDMQKTVDQFQSAVAALKDSVDMQKAKEEENAQEQPSEDLEQELRATFGAQEGEETVEDYMHAEAIRTGAEIIDKSWVLDLKGMETMDETAIITAGMRVKGDILSNGSADIIGEVIGNVQVKGKLNVTGRINGNAKAEEIFADSARVNGDMISDSTVKIGMDSVVIGNIEATSAVIAGAVKGTIDVKGPVILDTTAVVLGNVRAKSMQINNGARIEGMCVLCYAEQSAAKFFEEQASL